MTEGSLGLTSNGHVFVAAGDLRHLACDGLLLPSGSDGHSVSTWSDLRPHLPYLPGDPADIGCWDLPDGPSACLVDSSTDVSDDPDELAARIRDALSELIVHVRLRSDNDTDGRLPLIGIPLLGVRYGGFASVRGTILGRLLEEAQHAAKSFNVDVALICWGRADYAAVQSQERNFSALTDVLEVQAKALARTIRDKRTVLFLGAGLSMELGLPSWRDLLREIDPTGIDSGQDPYLWGSALVSELGETAVRDAVLAAVRTKQSSLIHMLLSSLSPQGVITTNFDEALELGRVQPPTMAVLPWTSPNQSEPWMLQLHGSPSRGWYVLTQEHVNALRQGRTPLTGVLQASALTGHIIFIGCSMDDRAVLDSLDSVATVVAEASGSYRSFATSLHVTDPPTALPTYIQAIRLGADVGLSGAVRDLKIFLDRVGQHAAAGESSYLGDPAFEGLLDEAERRAVAELGQIQMPATARFDALRAALTEFGFSNGKRPM